MIGVFTVRGTDWLSHIQEHVKTKVIKKQSVGQPNMNVACERADVEPTALAESVADNIRRYHETVSVVLWESVVVEQEGRELKWQLLCILRSILFKVKANIHNGFNYFSESRER